MTYIIISYLVMLGMILETNKSLNELSWKELIAYIFSPIVLPIIVGMMISNK